MEIVLVKDKNDLKAFIELPYQLYKKDKNWVAPLRSEQWAQFDQLHNPMFEHCTFALFLLKDGKKVVGRIAAFIDRLALEYWKEPIGLFGSFECINDQKAANMLLDTAKDWVKKFGMFSMRGPWSFSSQDWGIIVEGFEPPPMILAPYNPPYYNDLFTAYGLEKRKDLLVFYIDAREGYQVPERIITMTDKIQAKHGVRVRPVNMKKLEEEVMTIINLANQSIADNWGYYPVTDKEGHAMAKDLKPIINPKAVVIAETNDGKPIGFGMALPDINKLLKGHDGRLFPLGWLKMLFGLRGLKQYRMWALGIVPEYQGLAVDALIYRAIAEALFTPNLRLEINYVLDDNLRMLNAVEKLGGKPLRRYRVYQMPL
jgi:hypothetical protein